MGLYIYITEQDRINMRKVADIELKELFDEALEHDKTLMISAVNYTEKQGLFKRPKTLIRYTIYHESLINDKRAYQAREQVSASGSKQLVMAYLYGIINGSYANQRNKPS